MKHFVRFFLAICFLQLGFLSSLQGYANADKQTSQTLHFSFHHQFVHSFADVFDAQPEYNPILDTKVSIMDVELPESENEEEEEHEHIPDLNTSTQAANYFLALFNVLLQDPSTLSSNNSLTDNGLVSLNAVRRHVRLCVFRV